MSARNLGQRLLDDGPGLAVSGVAAGALAEAVVLIAAGPGRQALMWLTIITIFTGMALMLAYLADGVPEPPSRGFNHIAAFSILLPILLLIAGLPAALGAPAEIHRAACVTAGVVVLAGFAVGFVNAWRDEREHRASRSEQA